MKILMIGLGSIGQRHLRNIRRIWGDEHEILACRTRRLQQTFSDDMKIREGVCLEEEFGLKVFTDLHEALAEKPDVAFVTNITSKHMDTALQCAHAGCDLLIEKPLSDTLEGVDELKRIVEEKKITVFMGFQNRYHVCIREAKKLLEEERIGAVLSVDSEFSERLTTMHSYEDYRGTYMARADMGGGPVLNLQVHDLDLLHYLFGSPTEVFSVMCRNSSLEIDVEDGATSVYLFKNSRGDSFPAYTHTDFIQYPPVHRFKIVGEKGRIEIDMNRASLQLIIEGETVMDSVFGEFQRNDMFIQELEDFFACIREKKASVIDLEQGIVSLKMAAAAKRSAGEKRCISMEEM